MPVSGRVWTWNFELYGDAFVARIFWKAWKSLDKLDTFEDLLSSDNEADESMETSFNFSEISKLSPGKQRSRNRNANNNSVDDEETLALPSLEMKFDPMMDSGDSDLPDLEELPAPGAQSEVSSYSQRGGLCRNYRTKLFLEQISSTWPEKKKSKRKWWRKRWLERENRSSNGRWRNERGKGWRIRSRAAWSKVPSKSTVFKTCTLLAKHWTIGSK